MLKENPKKRSREWQLNTFEIHFSFKDVLELNQTNVTVAFSRAVYFISLNVQCNVIRSQFILRGLFFFFFFRTVHAEHRKRRYKFLSFSRLINAWRRWNERERTRFLCSITTSEFNETKKINSCPPHLIGLSCWLCRRRESFIALFGQLFRSIALVLFLYQIEYMKKAHGD